MPFGKCERNPRPCLISCKLPMSSRLITTMQRLEGKAALVTGGGTGIGRATAVLFASEGAAVCVAGRRERPLLETVDLVHEIGGAAEAISGDVSMDESARAMVDATVAAHGRLDIVVHSAGIARRNQVIADLTDEDVDLQLAINLKGFLWIAKHATSHMVDHGGGSIVAVSSLLSTVGIPGIAVYSATKGGINSLARNLASEFAGAGVRVNTVSPADVRTDMLYEGREDFDDYADAYAQAYPLGRIGTPEDVAHAVLYLASDEAAWVTGQNLVLDGGFTLT